MQRSFPPERFAVWREGDEDLPPVRHPPAALDQSPVHRPANQLDRAVMLQLQPLGKVADRRIPPVREALQGKE